MTSMSRILPLDVMMPKVDGFEVCRRLRGKSLVPVIMVTARGEDFEKIMGLDIGADDYIIKPFSAGEVMARVRAILRRMQPREEKTAHNIYRYSNLMIDLDKYAVTVNGSEVPLTKKEVELLWTLAKNSSKVFSRDNLLDSLWGYDYYGDSRTVDSHIKRMRAKLDKFEHPKQMHNKIALKLTLYFAAVLLVFALVVGGSFAHFFREHTVDIKSTELKQRAVRIAEVLSENAGWLEKRGGIANTRFISYINNITMEDVWVVNSDRELKLPQRMNHHMGMHRRMMHADTQAQVPPLKEFPRRSVTFEQLSDVTRNCVEQAFAGTVSVAEDFNPVREETMLCAAAPVYDENGAIQAAVLLHYPVQGLQSATWEGVRILLLSCAIALLLVSFLSVLFSWKFTRPLNRMKEVAQKMAEHDYTERCNIKQNDEIGALAATLDELGSRLLDADEAGRKLEKLRRSFIANISHELRTPVTVIRGSLEALNDKVVTDKEEVEQYYRQMLKESLFLQRLINDLLDLSRLQNTDFPIEKENINLCDVVQDAARASKQLGQKKGVHVDVKLDRNVYLMEGDYGRLRQMLMIFLDNSIKFSHEGGTVELRLLGDRLTVTDHGSGVKQEDLPYVFERFYKTRGEANKNGSGLGLAIAREIALRHNIKVSMESVPDEETAVIMILPPAGEDAENELRM